jgi:glucose-1-phosphate cytidylyltransferase
MKAVILCGGQGSRIRDVAGGLPKPMVEIGGRPILWHIMKIYAEGGVTDFVLLLGYQGWAIKEYFLRYNLAEADVTIDLSNGGQTVRGGGRENWTVTLVETGAEAETGARLWRARRYLEECDEFCLAYGDGVADLNLRSLLAYHRGHGRVATVTTVRPGGRFGVVTTKQSGDYEIVSEFAEKPQANAGWISGGFFVFSRRVWEYLGDDERLILERAPLEGLARDGQLASFPHRGFWQPMDTYREWRLLNDLWSSGDAPWKIWT